MNEQQEEINLFVAMDLDAWSFRNDDHFHIAIVSEEINKGLTFSCPFNW